MRDIDKELEKISPEKKAEMYEFGCWNGDCDGTCFDPTCTKKIIKKLDKKNVFGGVK